MLLFQSSRKHILQPIAWRALQLHPGRILSWKQRWKSLFLRDRGHSYHLRHPRRYFTWRGWKVISRGGRRFRLVPGREGFTMKRKFKRHIEAIFLNFPLHFEGYGNSPDYTPTQSISKFFSGYFWLPKNNQMWLFLYELKIVKPHKSVKVECKVVYCKYFCTMYKPVSIMVLEVQYIYTDSLEQKISLWGITFKMLTFDIWMYQNRI